METAEARIFESDPLFEDTKQLRLWDDEAKYDGLVVPGFETYREKIMACITEPEKTAKETLRLGALEPTIEGNGTISITLNLTLTLTPMEGLAPITATGISSLVCRRIR